MLKGLLRATKKGLGITADLFFPRLCTACGRKTKKDWLCPACENRVKIIPMPGCYSSIEIPGRPGGNKIRVVTACYYQNPLKSLIHSFKYKHRQRLHEFLSSLIIKQLQNIRFNLREYDFLVPVAAHPNKVKTRGYNQAALLAADLANYFKILLKNDIITSKYIKDSQTGLAGDERRRNVEGKFTVKRNIENKNIILVDDVLTTGATIKSCCRVLQEKNAGKICAVTLAK